MLDFSFLKTLPIDQVRNGMAEIIKIAVVANSGIFELLEKYGEDLLHTRFGHLDGTPELREIAHRVTYDAIDDDAAARGAQPARARPRPGHRLRPHLEPDPRAGARRCRSSTVTPSAIDMAFSATIAEQRGSSAISERDRIFWLMSRLGLAIDSPYLTPELLAEGDRVDPADPRRAAARGGAAARSAPASSSTT